MARAHLSSSLLCCPFQSTCQGTLSPVPRRPCLPIFLPRTLFSHQLSSLKDPHLSLDHLTVWWRPKPAVLHQILSRRRRSLVSSAPAQSYSRPLQSSCTRLANERWFPPYSNRENKWDHKTNFSLTCYLSLIPCCAEPAK
jgi:hypothetical protein